MDDPWLHIFSISGHSVLTDVSHKASMGGPRTVSKQTGPSARGVRDQFLSVDITFIAKVGQNWNPEIQNMASQGSSIIMVVPEVSARSVQQS